MFISFVMFHWREYLISVSLGDEGCFQKVGAFFRKYCTGLAKCSKPLKFIDVKFGGAVVARQKRGWLYIEEKNILVLVF